MAYQAEREKKADERQKRYGPIPRSYRVVAKVITKILNVLEVDGLFYNSKFRYFVHYLSTINSIYYDIFNFILYGELNIEDAGFLVEVKELKRLFKILMNDREKGSLRVLIEEYSDDKNVQKYIRMLQRNIYVTFRENWPKNASA